MLAELGGGSHSRVFRVRRAGAGESAQQYALKILDPAASGSRPAQVAFRREAVMLAGVAHPDLTVIHEVGEADGQAYLVMDLVEGVSLAQVLAGGALPVERVLVLALELLGPLAAVHRAGLVHRDLKPDNVMVLPDGRSRLIDFGLAARGVDEALDTAVGTLAYAAPEQTGMLNRPVDRQSDLYSLGVMLFECLAGHLPFAAAEVGELMRMHAVTRAPSLLELVPGIPAELAAAVARLLAKDPDDRHGSAEELAADLLRLLPEGKAPAIAADPIAAAGGRHPLRGRSQELAGIVSRWATVRAGSGQTCVIRGSSGVGKTRLVQELMDQVRAGGGAVIHGRSAADHVVPLATLRAAVEDYLRWVEAQPGSERERRRQQVVRAAAQDGELLAGLTPALGALIGPSLRADPSSSREESVGPERFALAVADFLLALARESQGLLLFMDDVQWVDPGTESVLAQVVPLLAEVPLMIVATTGDGDAAAGAGAGAWPPTWREGAGADVVLGPLADPAIIEVVDDLLPGLGAAAAVTSLLCVRGAGNPFIVQEYLRAVVDAGLLRPAWGTWELDAEGLDNLELPQDAMGLVLSRVQRLGPQARELLVVAAAVGPRFRPSVVAAVSGVGLDVVQAAVRDAVEYQLVEPRGTGEFSFLLERIREVLHQELSSAEAMRVHQRIAAALEVEPVPVGGPGLEQVYALAHHYLAGEPNADPKRAFAAYRDAGRLALENHAPDDAVMFLQNAARTAALPDGSEFSLTLGDALMRNNQYPQALECLGQALAVELDPVVRASILARMAETHRAAWDLDAGLAAVRQGLTELGARLPRNRFVLVLSTVGMFAVAQLMRLTGWGFGSARADRLRRAALITELHYTGAHIAIRGTRPAPIVLHTLRMCYWANRIGPGGSYVRSQIGLMFIFGQLGLSRAAERAIARATADPAAQEPGLRAQTVCSAGVSRYMGFQDDGQSMATSLETHGRWLEAGLYCDAASLILASSVMHGLTGEAGRWLALTQARLALGNDDEASASLSLVAPLLPALNGSPREAAAAVAAAREYVPSGPPTGMAIGWHVSQLTGLCEQDETGEPFNRAVAEFETLGLTPQQLIRPFRVIYFMIAMGRLAQCRADDGGRERAARLARARAAVRTLGVACRGNELRARARIARADLLILEGHPDQALSVLDAMVPIRYPDAPLLAYEAARVRARALLALGSAHDAGRQARLAAVIAQDNGWPHRVRWVGAEFGVSQVRFRGVGTRSEGPFASVGNPAASVALARHTSNGGSASASMNRERLSALEQVGAAASRVLDPGALARIALDETVRILAAERAFLFLTDQAGDLVPHLGRDAQGQDVPELTGHSASLVERVRESRELLVVTGTEEGAALGAESVVLHGLRSILVAPLLLEGRLLGVVYLDSRVAKGIFTTEDAGILTALTNHIATSLETARAAQLEISVQTVQRQRDLGDLLRRALESMTSTVEPKQVLTRLLSWSAVLTGCDQAWVLTGDAGSCSLLGTDPDGQPLTVELVPRDQALADLLGLAAATIGTPAMVPTALTEHLAEGSAWIALPLGTGENAFGVLIMASGQDDNGLGDQLEVASVLAMQGMTAYQNARLFARVQELSVVDELTGLANRRRFFEVADRDVVAAHRGERPLVAMMVDIDHFKQVNDTYGHPTGDDVIAEVARRLAATVGGSDVVGRYGGEEFALVLPDFAAGSDLPERLRDCVAGTPVPTRSGPLPVTVSIGLTHLAPGDANVAALLARADQALYTAKREGRNCVRTA